MIVRYSKEVEVRTSASHKKEENIRLPEGIVVKLLEEETVGQLYGRRSLAGYSIQGLYRFLYPSRLSGELARISGMRHSALGLWLAELTFIGSNDVLWCPTELLVIPDPPF
jgi:hypothetical protein